MRLQRSRDTRPELAIRRQLHRLGLRYRVHTAPLPGLRRRADIVFSRARVAVFVDGCFWHGCPEHGNHRVVANTWYWPDKIAGNRDRDADTDRRLREAGWEVIRVWEHDDPQAVAEQVRQLVTHRRDTAAAACRVAQAVVDAARAAPLGTPAEPVRSAWQELADQTPDRQV